MKLPRDISGMQLAVAPRKLGYQIDRQTGSHIRLTTQVPSEHHITVPAHNPLKIGTLSSILRAVGEHVGMDREQLINTLFG
jgi:predicted RNA binding protein YcfA (HicA-like mRNA interferase family)